MPFAPICLGDECPGCSTCDHYVRLDEQDNGSIIDAAERLAALENELIAEAFSLSEAVDRRVGTQ
jgi:hypothetical protein